MTTAAPPRSSFTVPVATFAAALAPCVGLVRRTTILPILSTVRWDGQSVTGTDQEMWTTTHVAPPDMAAGPAVCLNAAKLMEIVKGLAYKEMRLEWTEKGAELFNGRDRYKLPGIPGEEYPMAPTVEGTPFTLPAVVLGRALAAARYAIDHGAIEDAARPAYQGVNLTLKDGTLETVATNGKRLARHRVKSDGTGHCLIRWATVDRLVALLGPGESENMVEVVAGESQIRVTMERRWTLTARLISEEFPETASLFDAKKKHISFALPRKEWMGAITRAKATTGLGGRIVVSLADEWATLRGSDDNTGDSDVQVKCAAADKDNTAEFAVNATYLREALADLEGDTALLRFNPSLPIHLQDTAGSEALVVPLRSGWT